MHTLYVCQIDSHTTACYTFCYNFVHVVHVKSILKYESYNLLGKNELTIIDLIIVIGRFWTTAVEFLYTTVMVKVACPLQHYTVSCQIKKVLSLKDPNLRNFYLLFKRTEI